MRHCPCCTKIYSVRKLANARVRNFYAYENFCDYRTKFNAFSFVLWSLAGHNVPKLVFTSKELAIFENCSLLKICSFTVASVQKAPGLIFLSRSGSDRWRRRELSSEAWGWGILHHYGEVWKPSLSPWQAQAWRQNPLGEHFMKNAGGKNSWFNSLACGCLLMVLWESDWDKGRGIRSKGRKGERGTEMQNGT